MGEALAKQSVAEYLVWEPFQEERHMYVRGEIFAMSPNTVQHNETTLQIAQVLKYHLANTGHILQVLNMRVAVEKAACYFYPDVVVTCAERDTQNPKITEIHEAKLIIEVLSESTASYDRGAKFADYRLLDTLQEYVLVDPDARTVEVFRKNAANIWELHPSNAASPTVTLKSVDLQGDITQLLS